MDENVYVAPEDGGPAFPVLSDYAPNGQLVAGGTYGMSLRDWFAGMALQGFVASAFHYMSDESTPDTATPAALRLMKDIGGVSYQIADAMIQARKEAPNA